MSNRTVTPGDHLEDVFKTVVDEARTNPAFAARLRAALSRHGATGTSSTPRDKPARQVSPPAIHAVNILRQHGEQMLRGRLSNLRTKADLIQVARRSGLRLTGPAAKKSATRPELIDGIVAAAVQYDRQREAAEG